MATLALDGAVIYVNVLCATGGRVGSDRRLEALIAMPMGGHVSAANNPFAHRAPRIAAGAVQ